MVESKDRKANAHLILKLMCDSVVLRPHLRELLSAKYDSLFLGAHTSKKYKRLTSCYLFYLLFIVYLPICPSKVLMYIGV